MAWFPKISQFFSFFPSPREQAGSVDSSGHANKDYFAPEALKAAIDRKFEGIRPQSRPVASILPRIARALNRQLKSRGNEFDVFREDGERVLARRTGLSRICKHSKGPQFSVTLQNGQTVDRSRSEIKTHVLLQSYLKAAHGDLAIPPESG